VLAGKIIGEAPCGIAYFQLKVCPQSADKDGGSKKVPSRPAIIDPGPAHRRNSLARFSDGTTREPFFLEPGMASVSHTKKRGCPQGVPCRIDTAIEQRNTRMRELMASGVPNSALARLFGISRERVRQIRARLGFPATKRRGIIRNIDLGKKVSLPLLPPNDIHWRTCEAFVGYAAGCDGSIWRLRDNRLIKPKRSGLGQYAQYDFFIDGGTVFTLVHTFIATAFHGKRPPGLECDHINRNRGDNRAGNLRWVTRSENRRNSDRYERSHGQSLIGSVLP